MIMEILLVPTGNFGFMAPAAFVTMVLGQSTQ
jgi:hypothetical protein